MTSYLRDLWSHLVPEQFLAELELFLQQMRMLVDEGKVTQTEKHILKCWHLAKTVFFVVLVLKRRQKVQLPHSGGGTGMSSGNCLPAHSSCVPLQHSHQWTYRVIQPHVCTALPFQCILL